MGIKFEPLSILLYENLYDTIISEYGCIESDSYDYLAASPDGINTKIDNPRYGRLLEVKKPNKSRNHRYSKKRILDTNAAANGGLKFR